MIADVVNISGMQTYSTGPLAGGTDPFALQMSYNPNLIVYGGHTGTAAEALAAPLGVISLVYLSPVLGWTNAIYGNAFVGGDVTSAMLDYQGSFASFESLYGVNAGDLNLYVGAWGVDTTNHEAWAVLDHNSQFTVVPEPSSFVIAALSLLGLGWAARRRRRSAG
jgi:MYXO-CTERM domain-containing protein